MTEAFKQANSPAENSPAWNSLKKHQSVQTLCSCHQIQASIFSVRTGGRSHPKTMQRKISAKRDKRTFGPHGRSLQQQFRSVFEIMTTIRCVYMDFPWKQEGELTQWENTRWAREVRSSIPAKSFYEGGQSTPKARLDGNPKLWNTLHFEINLASPQNAELG